ncbi:MAG: acyl-CoA dehydratase activase [candidate division KSB1 bacterium]|nr:acyl-CoA dehydratase activase [candidate division KSB1 bacterium]MDZ7336067.1 acyl-CoA dehydratase activase [candidate division KSB1 bacterium]MDZ7358689.1 acyl-CoA dehydratase activase [candidate division KSB1 bacterium]MDZ7399613.1 acyl-CoA dehydratase activase [candidate division KSB1 bacterium]
MPAKKNERYYLGIDVGSVSLGYAVLDQDRQIHQSGYLFHRGNIYAALESCLAQLDLSNICQIAFNHRAVDFFANGLGVNDQVAVIEGVKFLVNDVGSIFTVGGETFGLILLDEQGHYQKFISNSSCAAGTGAFLDQQAGRLGLSGSAELSQLAETFSGEPPKIATRCAVFAKTDLIHCQQQGYSVSAIAAGLCKGLAHNITDTLIKGIELRSPVVVVGGVAKNKKVIEYISEIIGRPISIPEHAELAGAIGCALTAQQKQRQDSECSGFAEHPNIILKQQSQEKHYFFPPLKSELSVFPNFDDHSHYLSDSVEVDIYHLPNQSGVVPIFMGIDIGSTSTKAIVMHAQEEEHNILLGLYTRTMGQPIKATQALLRALREIEQKYDIQFEFCGVGTTGSGRKFIAKVLNADLVIDEITAHARAAYALNPQVDTIIEIGGQDSKFTVLKNGQVTFSVMNYVCAAGTGSFIEEQAKRLNVPLSDYSKLAVGTASPLTSDRCTVFMERDLNHLMSQGYSKSELLAAVLHSVRDNYLSKVAHLNKIGNVICFQGATAKNHALVMAFEQKLKKPIFVSKYCHLTGALGVCLIMKEELKSNGSALTPKSSPESNSTLEMRSEQLPQQALAQAPVQANFERRVADVQVASQCLPKSKFRGIEFYKESPEVINEICDGCKNHCKLVRIHMADEDIVWGYLCGRDESSDGFIPRQKSRFDLLSQRRRILNPAPALRQLNPEIAEKKLTNLLEELKRINLSDSLEKIKQIDLDLLQDKLKDLNLNALLDKLKQLNLNIPLGKLKQLIDLNLLSLRHRIFTLQQEDIQPTKAKNEITIGIPNTLYVIEYAPFWELFFKKLGYTVKLSMARSEFLENGKEIAGAEFCAPLCYWHGHVKQLSESVDYLFLPHSFEGGDPSNPKFYCYYSNYAVALVQNIEALQLKDRCIAPIIDFSRPAIYNVQQLYESLPAALKLIQTPTEIQKAYTEAWQWFTEQRRQLIELYRRQRHWFDDISVVLLGRPYLTLDAVMSKNIPQKFADMGISAFFQDMLPLAELQPSPITRDYLNWNHWKFASDILKAAEYACQQPGLYPVILTAFKCSPDSFVLSYLKEIMDYHQKPYLVLQLDEHGSDVGYETRIEAAVRSFRNHYRQGGTAPHPKASSSILLTIYKGGTILIPNFDSLSCSLIAAAFEHAGYDARMIEETPTSVVSSLRLNDGQCLPVSAIASAAVETIEKYRLQPEKTAIFLNALSRLACNFPQYPLMAKKLLEQYGHGFEKVQVFATEFEMRGMPFELIYDVYCSYLLGGLLRKIACKIRPYEIILGQTDQLIEQGRQKLYQCIQHGESKEAVFREIVAQLAAVPVSENYGTRPKVSIIGDLYVRDNDVFNQQLIKQLESYGAEVVTTPFTYILRMQAVKHNYNLKEEKQYLALLRDKLLVEVLEKFEKRFFQIANEIFQEEFPTFDDSIFENLIRYNLSLRHGGETAQNVMKIFSLLNHYPDLKLFIHINPIFCCPGLVSESLFKKIEKDIGIPIVSIIYDGTATRRNDVLAPYLHYITQRLGVMKELPLQTSKV